MKKISMLLVTLLLASFVAATPGAKPDNINGIDEECQLFGYDHGIVKWEWEGSWMPEGGDPLGIYVQGSDTYAEWDLGASDAEIVVVKAGQQRFAVSAIDSDYVAQDEPAISHLTFCSDRKPDCPPPQGQVPEFGTLAGVAALVGIGAFAMKKRK